MNEKIVRTSVEIGTTELFVNGVGTYYWVKFQENVLEHLQCDISEVEWFSKPLKNGVCIIKGERVG